MATEKERTMFTFDDGLYERVENFRFTQKYPTRSMAINALIKAGLEVLENNPNYSIKKATRKKRKLKQ